MLCDDQSGSIAANSVDDMQWLTSIPGTVQRTLGSDIRDGMLAAGTQLGMIHVAPRRTRPRLVQRRHDVFV